MVMRYQDRLSPRLPRGAKQKRNKPAGGEEASHGDDLVALREGGVGYPYQGATSTEKK